MRDMYYGVCMKKDAWLDRRKEPLKIAYIDYDMYGKEDVQSAFRMIGHEVVCCTIPLECGEVNAVIRPGLMQYLEENAIELAFTSNYYPVVSDVCEKLHIKYLSWSYDSPLVNLYDRSIINKCNYAFTFDRDECKNLWSKGIDTVYYMPLAVNTERLNNITLTEQEKKKYACEVSFVGSLYNESHNLYDRMEQKLDAYTNGYLHGVMQVQRELFGGFVMENAISQPQVLSAMYQAMPYDVHKGSYATREYVYANYFLARKVANMQRMEYVEAISKRYDMKIYTAGDTTQIPTVQNMGPIDYEIGMNKVFKASKINFNITLPSIHTGVPLRVMDILGNGGFLLTNYQQDLFELLQPDVDFVYFASKEEALSKIAYYLEHEDERRQIANHAGETMRAQFDYKNRLADMLYIVEQNKEDL